MTAKTLEELKAQIAEAQREIAILEVAPLQAINKAIAKVDFSALAKTITDNLELLTDERKQQAQNILTILNHSPSFLADQAQQLENLINPPPAPAPEVKPDEPQ